MTAEDVRTLEACADELMRQGSAGHAVKLWALALKVRADMKWSEQIHELELQRGEIP